MLNAVSAECPEFLPMREAWEAMLTGDPAMEHGVFGLAKATLDQLNARIEALY